MTGGLWERERQRAALYVAQRARDREALLCAVFARANAHAEWAEHRHAQRRRQEEQQEEEEEEEEEKGIDLGLDGEDESVAAPEELALDFLGDVNADEMRTLLVAHAPAEEPTATTTTLAPLAMPPHLLSTASAASVMTTTMVGVAVGVSMGEDAGVSELMDELQIEVQALTTSMATASHERSHGRHDEDEEHKTEESIPPRHVREQRVQREGEEVMHSPSASKGPSPAKRPIGGALETVWKDVFDPETVAANEMLTWVTGKNDPEVIKRHETLRGEKKRRATKRFGTDTYAEQASIRRVAKYHAGEGESSSSSSDEVKSDSDFSPQEVVEIEDDDEDEEMFSDTDVLREGVAEDDEKKRRGRQLAARRRIRQRPRTKMTIRKVPPKANAIKRQQRDESNVDEKSLVQPPTEIKSLKRKRDARIIHEEPEEHEVIQETEPKHDEPQAIDLRSESEAEAEPDIPPNDEQEPAASREVKKADEKGEETKSDFVVRLKISSQDFEKLRQDSSESDIVSAEREPEQEAQGQGESREQSLNIEDDGYGTDDIADAGADAADESDTGTLDLENEEMLTQLDENSKGSPASTSSVAANGLLNPLEPQVKMSPQQSTPPQNARALQSDSPVAKNIGNADAKTAEFVEVSSDIDFGSGESEDFAGDVVAEDASDEEAEFGQFFESSRKKQVPIASQAPPPDASAVKKINVEEPPASSTSPAVDNAGPTPVKPAADPSAEKGSNGLRKVPNMNTTTVSKGKFKHTRNAIRLLDADMNVTNSEPTMHDPKRNLVSRSRFAGSAGPPPSGEVSPHGDRYLKYDRTFIQPRTSWKDEVKNAAKEVRERFDKRTGNSTTKTSTHSSITQTPAAVTFESATIGTGSGLLVPLEGMVTSDGKFVTPREPQLDIYQATDAKSKYDDDAPLSESVYKRPSKFVKEINEAKRQGVDVRKGTPEELDPKAKIPKKSSKQLALERTLKGNPVVLKNVTHDKHSTTTSPKAKRSKTGKSIDESDRSPNSTHQSKASSVPAKSTKSSKTSSSNGHPSHYGPTDHDSSQRRRDENQSRRSGAKGKKRPRSLSPLSKSRDRENRDGSYRGRDKHRDRDYGRDRDRDYGLDRERDRERDRKRERERDSERDRRHDRSRSPFDSKRRDRRTPSPPSHRSSHDRHSRSSSRHSRSRSRSRSTSRSAPRIEPRRTEDREKVRERDPRSVTSYASAETISESMKATQESVAELKQQPRSMLLSSREVKEPGALAVFEDGEDSEIAASDIEFVDDFDDDSNDAVFDIRYNLSEVKIDRELLERMVYVCNLSPQVDEVEVMAMFQEFGIAEQDELGCPAVEVFMCQRSHRARGDARVTFTSAEAVSLAVERVQASISGNSRVTVRPMDKHTMRVLHVQFDTFRDTWLCPDPNCRAETSYWARACSKCSRYRVFPPSNVKIRAQDWLCSICFATNGSHAEKCHVCDSKLPPLPDTRPRNGYHH